MCTWAAASLGLFSTMLDGPATLPRTEATVSKIAWSSGFTWERSVIGVTRGIGSPRPHTRPSRTEPFPAASGRPFNQLIGHLALSRSWLRVAGLFISCHDRLKSVLQV